MAPTTQADNKNKHPGYCVLSKPPQTTQSPSKTKAKSQLEQDTIVNDIAALKAQLHTKQQQSRSMARQPPGPSRGKQPRLVKSSNKGKMRKRLPMSGEESSDDNGTTTRVSKKQRGNAGNANEGVPVVRGNKSAAVQKVSKKGSGHRNAEVADGDRVRTDGAGRAVDPKDACARPDHQERNAAVDTCEENDMDVDKDSGRGQQAQRQKTGVLGAPFAQLKPKSSMMVPHTSTEVREVEEEDEMMVDDDNNEGHTEGVRLGSATTKQGGKGKRAASQG